ncbi:MAG: SMC-Scp complex subunit ScpB [Candidatus Omnitrophica bacterium]|nr:SMC-Scp complex subunit ScpB [Candidatus Omnitrophota bacterium]
MERGELKSALEAILFVADKPLTIEQASDATGEETRVLREVLGEMSAEYDAPGRGFLLKEIAGAFQLVSNPKYSEMVTAYAVSKEKKKLTGAGLETLSIIAYRQPVTRQEIEYIRGVAVDGALKTLTERGLIKMVGRKDVPGRPILYGTTKDFLDHFGLAHLRELPKLAEFTEKDIELPESLKSHDALPEISEDVTGSDLSETDEAPLVSDDNAGEEPA